MSTVELEPSIETTHCPRCGSLIKSCLSETDADPSNQSPGADLVEHLFVALLKAEEIVLTYADRIKFTIKDIAFILRTGESTIKDAITAGKLKKSPAGTVMKSALIEWLDGDPIDEYLQQVTMLRNRLRDLSRQMAAAIPPVIPPTNPSDSV